MSLDEIANLPREGDEPVFCAPWAARAFAMTVSLSQAGYLTWVEWAAVFSAELQQSEHATPAKAAATHYYYECWVTALEKLLTRKGLVSPSSLQTSLHEAIANWPEPDHTARREPVARSLPTDDAGRVAVQTVRS